MSEALDVYYQARFEDDSLGPKQALTPNWIGWLRVLKTEGNRPVKWYECHSARCDKPLKIVPGMTYTKAFCVK